MKKNINVLYELNTPTGYLGMGYDIKSIPFIFEYINENRKLELNTIRYSSFGRYRKLIDGNDITYTLNSLINLPKTESKLKQKLYTELTESELKNDINFFNIPTLADETIIEYIQNVDFESFFLKKTLNFIKNNPTVKIVFSDEREGSYVYSDLFFRKFHNFIKRHKIHNKQVVLITNTSNVYEQYNKFLKSKNLKDFMVVGWVPFLIMNESGQCISDCEKNKYKTTFNNETYTIPSRDDIDVKRKYHYLCLNRNSERHHRPQLVLELIKNDIFQKGKVSLLRSKGLEEFSKSNKDYQNLIVNRYPFVLDHENPEKVSQMHGYLTKKDMWLNTYFSIVTETSVLKNTVFITEKTIRPMIYYHPFIVWGNPKTLESLKKLGFETFPEFFNEEYDNIVDNDKRLKCIMDSVNKLCDKDLSEMYDLYQEVKPKLIHNYNLLKDFYNNGELLTIITNIIDSDKNVI